MLVSLHNSGTMFCGAMKALLSFTAQKFFFNNYNRISRSGGSFIFWECVAFTGLGDLVPVDGTIKENI